MSLDVKLLKRACKSCIFRIKISMSILLIQKALYVSPHICHLQRSDGDIFFLGFNNPVQDTLIKKSASLLFYTSIVVHSTLTSKLYFHSSLSFNLLLSSLWRLFCEHFLMIPQEFLLSYFFIGLLLPLATVSCFTSALFSA